MADITMPQLGETVTEGTIIRWLKNVGDPVGQDEPLFEVSTEKVDSEVPSSAEGYLAEILVAEGATVDVGTRLAVISESAPGAGAPRTGAETGVAAVARPGEAAAGAEPSAVPPEVPAAAPVPPAQPTVAAEAPTVAAEAPSAVPIGTSGNGGGGPNGSAGLLSPVVRKLLNENNVEPSVITGTGQGGRITRADVLAYLDARSSGAVGAARPPAGAPPTPAPPAPARPAAGAAAAPTAAPATAPATAPTTAPAPPAPAGTAPAPPAALGAFPPAKPGERDEIVPFTNIRRLTAEHMVRSKATSAHTLVVVEADYEAVEKVRRRFKDRFKEEEGIGLSYLPFVARAVVDVLRDYPHLNASIGENSLLVHRDVHLGIAVDLDLQGLIVPVIHQADGQSLRGIARAVADLADRARTRRLSADDVVGGTFTITNPGPFGTFLTGPIINQPQVAILSTDGVKRRPVVVTAPDGSEAIAIHSVGMLALSFDHRAVDGAYASAFLRDLAREIETRDWEAEL